MRTRGRIAAGLIGLAVLLVAIVVVRNRDAPATDASSPARTVAGGIPATGANAAQPTGYKIDAIEFFLPPGSRVEYKYRLAAGAVMLYTWEADVPVHFDMHTVPDGKPISASESFLTGEQDQQHGTYTAPYSGLHGWYWENRGTRDVTIKVRTAGFYTEAFMFSDGEQTPFEIKDPPGP